MTKSNITTLIFSLILGLSLTLSVPIQAATPSPSAKPTATPAATPATTTEKLRERIERVVEEKKEQVKGVIDEIGGQKRAFIGEVQRVSAESITIKTFKGTQIIAIESGVNLVKQGNKISVDDIAVGDWTIVIGGTENDSFAPQHIIVSSKSLRPTTKVVILGTITAIGKSDITIQPRSKEESQVFTLTKATSYQDNEGNKIILKDIAKDVQVLLIGHQTEKGLDAVVIKSLAAPSTDTTDADN